MNWLEQLLRLGQSQPEFHQLLMSNPELFKQIIQGQTYNDSQPPISWDRNNLPMGYLGKDDKMLRNNVRGTLDQMLQLRVSPHWQNGLDGLDRAVRGLQMGPADDNYNRIKVPAFNYRVRG